MKDPNTMSKNTLAFSRRNFLRTMGILGVGAAGAGLAGCQPQAQSETTAAQNTTDQTASLTAAPDPIDESSVQETKSADVVVIGGGISGISTALSALEQGLKVILIEKNQYPRYTGLDFGCVNPSLAKDYGIPEVDPYEITREWVKTSSHRVRADHIMQYARNSGAAMDWACEKAQAWGAKPVISAQMSKSDAYPNIGVAIEFHDGPSWDPSTESFGSRDLIDSMTDQFTQNGGELMYETKAEQLVKEGDAVKAVIATDKDERIIKLEASKGVVLAAGDFAGDPDLLKTWAYPFDFDSFNPTHFLNCSTGLGEGQKMGIWAGGHLQQGPQPLMILPFTYPYFYLHVNNLGERFMNEDTSSVNMSVGQLLQPNAEAWSIWDSKWETELPASLEYGGGMDWDQDFRVYGEPWDLATEQATMEYNKENGMLFEADTLEELAEAAGIPVESFVQTVDRYNEIVTSGTDTDFGKRSELLTSITEPPFYALCMQTGLCVSVGGLEVNTRYQVLNDNSNPIEGLYAVGNSAGGFYGVDYEQAVVSGCSLGRCVTQGWLLGQFLAE